jgi:hypothetical protein
VFAAHGDKELAIVELEGCLILGEADESGELIETGGPLFVVRGNRVFALVPNGIESDVYARAEGIVFQDPASALISDSALVDLVDSLSVGRDGVAYVNVRALVAAGDQSFDEDSERLERDLEAVRAAKATGEPVEESIETIAEQAGRAAEEAVQAAERAIKEAEQAIEAAERGRAAVEVGHEDVVSVESEPLVHAYDIEWRQRQLNEITLMRGLLNGLVGSATGMAIGIELADGRLDLEATVGAASDSMLARLVSTRSGLSVLRLALPRAPWMLLDGALSPSELRGIVQMGFHVFGDDYDKTMALARGIGGVDMDPFELFTGELGFAMLPPRPVQPDRIYPMPFDVVATLNVRDPALAQKVLDHAGGLATMAGLGAYVESTKGLALTRGGDSIHLAVVGRSLVISTDPEAIEQLARGGRDIGGVISSPALAQHLPAVGQAGNWLMDMAMLAASPNAGSIETIQSSWPDAEGDSAEVRKLKAGLRQLEELTVRAPQRRRLEIARERATLLGVSGATLTVEETGFRVSAGWYFGSDHLASVIVRLGELSREESTLWEADPALQMRRDALMQALWQLEAAKAPADVMEPSQLPSPGDAPGDGDTDPNKPNMSIEPGSIYKHRKLDEDCE